MSRIPTRNLNQLFAQNPTQGFRFNPLAEAVTVPLRLRRQEQALAEVLSIRNPVFRTLPEDQKNSIVGSIVRGGPSFIQSTLGLPQDVVGLDKEGNFIPSTPFADLLPQSQQQTASSDNIFTRFARALGQTIRNSGQEPLPSAPGAPAEPVDEGLANLFRGTANEPPPPDIPLPPDVTAEEVDLNFRTSIPRPPTRSRGITRRLVDIRRAVRSEDRSKITPSKIRKEADNRGISVGQVIEELEQALGITNGN